MELTELEIRTLGCLIEKALTTPDYYPLTLNSLVAACSQKSNRNPVMTLDEDDVALALEALRIDHQMARRISEAGSRVAKYAHNFTDRYPLELSQLAVLCELMIRGPQTCGELRTRASRMCQLDSTDQVAEILQSLANLESGAMVVQLPRQPGCREPRWAHLLGGPIESNETDLDKELPPEPAVARVRADHERLTRLEQQVEELNNRLHDVERQFSDFKKQFE